MAGLCDSPSIELNIVEVELDNFKNIRDSKYVYKVLNISKVFEVYELDEVFNLFEVYKCICFWRS